MAILLNGTTTSFIDTKSAGSTSPLTPASISFCAWIKPAALTNAYSGIVYRTGGGYYQLFIKSSGQMAYYLSTTAGIDPGTATLSIGTWYHVGFSYNGSNGAFATYVNGVSDGSNTGAGSLAGITGTTGIGYDTTNGARYFNGSMAHAAIYNTALTAADFALLAQGMSPLAVKGANLAGYWPFDGSQGATDLGPNGLILQLNQAAADNDPPYIIPAPTRILSSNSQPTLNPNQLFPFGEWEMPALQGAAAAAAPPFIPNSNDNFNVRQAAQRAAAALLIVTQPFVPFNTTQVAPTVAKGWYNQLSPTAKAAIAQPTQPTSFAVPANFTPTPKQFGWYQPLGIAVPVAQAKPGSTFVPFNTTQVVQTIVRGWYGQTSTVAVRIATAQPTQPTSFAVPASVAPPAQTPGQFGWWENLSKSVPVAQARPGNTFVPFNTTQVVISPQTVPLNYDAHSPQARVVYYQSSFQVLRPIAYLNTITAIGWYQPLGAPVPVAQARPGNIFTPLDTRQVNSITGIGWYQNLSRSAPVAIAQAGFSFVPFNTRQVITVQVAFDPFVKKKHVSKRRRLEDNLLRQELEIKYKRRLAIEEAFWPPTTYELPPYQLPEHVKPAPDVSDLANVIMQVQQMRAAQARQQDEEDEKALLELLKREYGIEDV